MLYERLARTETGYLVRALFGGGEGRGDGEEGGGRGRRSRATVVLPGGAGKTVLRSFSMARPRLLSSASSSASSSAVPVSGRERVCSESMLGDGSPMAGSKVRRRRLAEGMHARVGSPRARTLSRTLIVV